MKTILVATDFSKCADNALVYAFEIARRANARIVLYHVVFPNQGVENNVYEAFWIDDYMKQREKALNHLIQKLHRNPDYKKVQIDIAITIGFPVPEIRRFAEEIKADLIVLGTTGATGLAGVMVGSTSGSILSKTRTPVLIVPPKRIFRKDTNVAFATDFHVKLGSHALDLMSSLLRMQNAYLKILHVLPKAGMQPDKTREASLTEKLEGIPHDFHYLHDQDLTQGVRNFVESTDATMLVTVSHEHSLLHRLFFESNTRKLAHKVKVPVLVLHDAG